MLLLSSADFSKLMLSKKIFQEHYQIVNSLDLDQDLHSVWPDLGPNHLERLPAGEKGHC